MKRSKNNVFFCQASNVFWGLVLLSFCQCSSKGFPKHDKTLYTFIESTAASVIISQDDPEGFFQQLSSIDMAIQMKTNATTNKQVQSDNFRQYLSREVSHWSPEEKKLMI